MAHVHFYVCALVEINVKRWSSRPSCGCLHWIVMN